MPDRIILSKLMKAIETWNHMHGKGDHNYTPDDHAESARFMSELTWNTIEKGCLEGCEFCHIHRMVMLKSPRTHEINMMREESAKIIGII